LMALKDELIHVPQGFSGRLYTQSRGLGITGLYTDGFSTCVIFVGWCKKDSADFAFLLHFDSITPISSLYEEISWLKLDLPAGSEIDLVECYRPNRCEQAKKFIALIHEDFEERKSKEFKQVRLNKVEVRPEEVLGVLIQFDQKSRLVTYPHQRPTTLLHHPQEMQLDTVQTISQVIGKRSFRDGARGKTQLIFNGMHWNIMDSKNLTLDQSPQIEKELANFKKEDRFLTIIGKLVALYRTFPTFPKSDTELVHLARDVAPELQYFLNDYRNEDQLFKDDIKDVEVSALQEIAPREEMSKLLNYILNRRKSYQATIKIQKQMYKSAKEKYSTGRESKNPDLLFEAIRMFVRCSTPDDINLAICYYSVGRTSGDKAGHFLSCSYWMLEKHANQKLKDRYLPRIKKALGASSPIDFLQVLC